MQWCLGTYGAILTKMPFASLPVVTSILILNVVRRYQWPGFRHPHFTTN